MAKKNGKPTTWPAERVEMWPLDKIKPYPKNPRTHPAEQISALANDMNVDGVTQPILVDEKGVIIAGHGRLLAAQQNNFAEYPVVVARGWTETQKKAARLKDNQRALQSDWDDDLLRIEIGELKLDDFDLSQLGFDTRDLDALLEPETVTEEETPALPKKPAVREGDLWVLGNHRLLCGDATSTKDVTRLLDGAKPHLMVADPPYGVDYDPDWRNRADRANGTPYGASAIGRVPNDHQSDWRQAWALFPGDVAYCWHAGIHASSTQEAMESAGLYVRAQIIWAKTRLIISRGHYHVQHEPCWYAVREKATGHWNGDRSQTTLWTIDHQKSETGHSAQKPIECMRRPIENNSKRGEGVYDPFVGSGTTIIAAEMMERKCFANDLDPGYTQVAIERWQQFTGRLAVLEGTSKTLDQVAASRRKGRAVSDSGKSIPRTDVAGDGAKQKVRGRVHARRAAPRRQPAGEPSAMAGDT